MIPKTRRLRLGYVLASVAFVAIPLSHWRISTTLHTVPQPGGIDFPEYRDFGPYTLHVMDRSLWWKVWEYGQVCEIRIVRNDEGPNGYGHSTYYTFHNYQSAPDYFIRYTCAWGPHGVRLTEPTGHELFIPAKAFTGGR